MEGKLSDLAGDRHVDHARPGGSPPGSAPERSALTTLKGPGEEKPVAVPQPIVRGLFRCGIMPITLRPGCTPGNELRAAIGVAGRGALPWASQYRNRTWSWSSSSMRVSSFAKYLPLSVRDGHLVSPVLKTPGQRTVPGLRPDVHVPAHETLADVVQQGPWKQPCLTEHLKPLHTPKTRPPLPACSTTSCMIREKRAMAPNGDESP